MHPKIKQFHDTAFRVCWCLVWLTATVFMLTNFVAYEQNSSGENAIGFAWRAAGCAVITITALCIHAYAVDKKAEEKHEQ